MDQRLVLILPLLVGLWAIGASATWYLPSAEAKLKGSYLLRTFGPGVIVTPFCMGVAVILIPVAYVSWPIPLLRNAIMSALVFAFLIGWLLFLWCPKQLLPRWLQASVKTRK